jgi:hypothetical protein
MNAYAKTRKQRAPHKVEELLREMGDIYKETGDRRTKPNTRSFNTCLDAWAKSGQPGAAARIMEWIELMNSSAESEQKNILSNKWTYNVSTVLYFLDMSLPRKKMYSHGRLVPSTHRRISKRYQSQAT